MDGNEPHLGPEPSRREEIERLERRADARVLEGNPLTGEISTAAGAGGEATAGPDRLVQRRCPPVSPPAARRTPGAG